MPPTEETIFTGHLDNFNEILKCDYESEDLFDLAGSGKVDILRYEPNSYGAGGVLSIVLSR